MAYFERDYSRGQFGNPFGGGAAGGSITMWLIGINCAVYVLDAVLTGSTRGDPRSGFDRAATTLFESVGAFQIETAVRQWQLWRWVTYQFLHADFFHLLVNMIGLYFFGRLMESWWGRRRFVAFYLLCGMSGGVLFTLFALVPGLLDVAPKTSLVGASGSIFGILAGCAILYPHQRVMLLFPPIPMTMRTMALIFLAIAALGVLAGADNAGGDAAHLGGAALGYLLVRRPNLLQFADRLRTGGIGQLNARRQDRKSQRQRDQIRRDQAEVDRILDKVRQNGMHSLTGREKRILKRATDRQRRAG